MTEIERRQIATWLRRQIDREAARRPARAGAEYWRWRDRLVQLHELLDEVDDTARPGTPPAAEAAGEAGT